MKSFFRAVKCFFWVSHLHLKWTFVARACEGLQGSTRGANGSRIKNILGKEKWFHEETFYKLRMELCSMITGIVCFQWRKQWRKILKQWNQFSNPWKKTGKTWSNSSQNWTIIISIKTYVQNNFNENVKSYFHLIVAKNISEGKIFNGITKIQFKWFL